MTPLGALSPDDFVAYIGLSHGRIEIRFLNTLLGYLTTANISVLIK